MGGEVELSLLWTQLYFKIRLQTIFVEQTCAALDFLWFPMMHTTLLLLSLHMCLHSTAACHQLLSPLTQFRFSLCGSSVVQTELLTPDHLSYRPFRELLWIDCRNQTEAIRQRREGHFHKARPSVRRDFNEKQLRRPETFEQTCAGNTACPVCANRGGGRSTQEESGRKQAHQGWKSHANHEWKPLEEVGERIESQRRALDEPASSSGLFQHDYEPGIQSGRNRSRLAVGSTDNSSPALFSAPQTAMFMLMFMLEWRKMIQCGSQAAPGLRLYHVDTFNQEQRGNCGKAANANTDTRPVNRQSRVFISYTFQ